MADDKPVLEWSSVPWHDGWTWLETRTVGSYLQVTTSPQSHGVSWFATGGFIDKRDHLSGSADSIIQAQLAAESAARELLRPMRERWDALWEGES